MRSFISAEEAPVLFASTYHAGEAMNLPADTDYKQRVCKLHAYISWIFFACANIDG